MKKILWIGIALALSPTSWAYDEQDRHQAEQQYKLTQKQQEQTLLEDTALLSQNDQKAMAAQDDEMSLTQAIFMAVNQERWQDLTKYAEKYQSLSEHSPVVVYFAQGALARAKGDYEQAERYFRQMMALDADFARGRLELARVLFENHKDDEVLQEFNRLYGQLPSQITPAIDAYLRAIDYRHQWQTSLSFGWTHNSNINQKMGKSACYASWLVGDEEICTHRRTVEKPVSDGAWTYNVAVYKKFPIKSQHSLYTKGMAYGTIYDTKSDYSQQTFNAAFGYRFDSAKHSFSVAPFYEHYRLAARSLYDGYGLTAEYGYQANGRLGVNLQSDYQKNDFKGRVNKDNYDGDILSHYLTANYQLSPQTMIFMGLNYSDKNTADKSNAFTQYGGRLGLYHAFDNRANLTALAMYRKTHCDEANVFIDPNAAKNHEQIYLLSYAMPNVNIKGFYPSISYKYSKQHSNVGWFYDYHGSEIGLKIQKNF